MKVKTTKVKKRATTTAKSRSLKVKPTSAKDVCKGIQRSVDSVLLSIPPKMQSNIDQVLKSIEVSPHLLQDLRTLGYRILKHATEISETLKGSKTVTTKSRSRKA